MVDSGLGCDLPAGTAGPEVNAATVGGNNAHIKPNESAPQDKNAVVAELESK